MQQLKIIEHYTKKRYPKVKIVPCKIIRDKNGIAHSSRNILLSTKENQIASKIYKLIFKYKSRILKKKISISLLKKYIYNLGVNKIDYIKILDVNKINKPYKKNNKYKVFIAYFLRSTRLIDNI